MSDDKFDVIIVGAGVAGSTAAYKLAQSGLEVVLIERGPYPGSKNLSGGVLYGRVLHDLIPNFWEEAPVERVVTNQVVSFMTGEASFNIDFKTESFNGAPYNALTVLRAKFDRWLAGKAEEVGASLIAGIKVDRLLRDGKKVIGVAAGDEEMLSDVVIAADGVNSFLTQEAGLRSKIPTGQVALGVKELIGLPREVIEERFHLVGNQGAAYSIVGYATRGVAGGGFLYTNIDSLSIGLVMLVDDLVRTKSRSAEILEEFLNNPMIAPLIKGGTLLEYGAHLVPEGGLEKMPPLFADGLLVIGDAAGFGVNNGFVVRGMDLAIGSAIAAADTIIGAKAINSFDLNTLSLYKQKLDKSYVMADMRTYARTPHFFQNRRLYQEYPDMLTNLMTQIYTEDALPKDHLVPTLMKSTRGSNISLVDLARDILDGVRSL